VATYPRRRPFTVAEYYAMARAGILSEDDRVELIKGEIVEMSPIGDLHAAAVTRAQKLFERRVGDRTIIRVQNPIHLGDDSEPQPDVVIARDRADFYASGHPRPEDILLVIEIADPSLAFERREKVPLYAASGIPEVWLAVVNRATLTAYADPSPEGYRTVRALRRDARLAPAAFPDLVVAVSDILG
jgi:Uma2 family endonuclease